MGNTIGPSNSTSPQTSVSGGSNQTATVMSGENTLSQIAQRLGISKDALIAANPNLNSENVQPGQELFLPINHQTNLPKPPVTQNAPITQRFDTASQRSEFGLSGQMWQVQLKQQLGTNSTAQAVPLDSKAALPSSPPTPESRYADMKSQLDSAKIPAKLRDELIAQGANKSGLMLGLYMDRIDSALTSKDPAGELKSIAMEGRIGAFKESFNSTYEVNGKKVQALPHFRIGDSGGGTGHSGPAGRHASADVQEDLTKLIQKNDKGHWNAKMQTAVHMVAYGRGNAEQIQMVTQSLIRGGQFDEAKKNHPGLSDSDTIRMMQWDHGIGIDCAGYVQQAFIGVHGGNRATYGLQPRIGDENLMNLKGNRHFQQVKPTDVKPGDLIALNPPPNDAVGHAILVNNHHQMGDFERKFFNMSGFAGPNDVVHVYSGDASWSGGTDGDLKGGVQTRMILYNETTGKWADVTPSKTGYDVQPSGATGPYNHPMNGIYRPR